MRNKKIGLIIGSLILIFISYNYLFSVDSEIPDTFANKRFFKKTFETGIITPDVKNIYCYFDNIGIDFSKELSFECSSATFDMITKKFNLQSLNKYFTNGFGSYLYKRNKQEIDNIIPYSDKEGMYSSSYHSIWYNSKNNHAYFLLSSYNIK